MSKIDHKLEARRIASQATGLLNQMAKNMTLEDAKNLDQTLTDIQDEYDRKNRWYLYRMKILLMTISGITLYVSKGYIGVWPAEISVMVMFSCLLIPFCALIAYSD